MYRAVDSTGQTLDFLLNATRSPRAAKRFFRKVLGRSKRTRPHVINVDRNSAYIDAVVELKAEGALSDTCQRRPSKYMNNIVEQDHRFIKRRIRPGLGFGSYETAARTIAGFEVMHMIRKGQIEDVDRHDAQAQRQFIHKLFGLAA